MRYREIIEIIADLSTEEFENIKEWLGYKFNPYTFNRITIEKELGNLGAKIKGY